MGWAEVAQVVWVAAGPPAATALATAVAAAKAGDPLAPVTVAVPSVFTGLGLRRSLVRGGGIVNVRFLVLARLAELLGAPSLAAVGRRPLTRARRAEAARRALLDEPGPFGDVAAHPATVRAVERAAAELRRAGPGAVAALAEVGGHAAHLVRLAHRAHELTSQFYDEQELYGSAARVVRAEGTASGDIGHVVLFLPRRVQAGERELLDAFAEAGLLTVLLGATGDALADQPSTQIAGHAPPASLRPPHGTAVVVAPDPDVEVRAVVGRLVARLHEGTPLHRMAVLYWSERPYRLLLHEHLGAARVPYRGSGIRTLAQTAAGRLLLGLLRLPAERFGRVAVLDWLTCSPVLEAPGGEPVPSLRWEAIARAANVVGGEVQWRDRLARYRWAVAHRLDRRLAEGEDDAATEGLRAELDHVDRLAAFIEELVRNASPPAHSSWAGHVAWARAVLHRYLGGEGHRGRWPDDELEAARAVEAALDGLAELDDLSSDPDGAAFAWVLEEQLRVRFGREGRFGDGVFVGRVGDAVGLDLDIVFVVGLAEGTFPERGRPDAMLDERAREATAGALPTVKARLADQRRDYLWALAAGRQERVLSFARADDRGRRERLPSRWLLETASHLAGRPLYADDLLGHPPTPWLVRVPSFAALPAEPPPTPELAASAQEVRLATLFSWTGAGGRLFDHPLVQREPALRRGLEARRARRARGLSRWDGLVGPLAQEARVLDRVQSATGLQWWATCPRRFFFERLLDVAETPTPEDDLQLPPLEAGTLVHLALERFLADTLPRTLPHQRWSPAERDHLAAILDDVFADAERRGITGRPLLWRIQRRRLRRDVLGFLDRDEQARARDGVVPVAGEMGFGLFDSEQPPVEVVTHSGRKVAFRGKVDRVDASPDGSRLVVLDYKTGSPQRYISLADDPVQAGRSLQLPLYALAARARFGPVPTEAAYWFVSERADYRRFPVALDDRTNARFLTVLDAIAEGIDAGVFPANPGKEDGRRRHAHCAVCPYDTVCPRDRRQAWERSQEDPALAPYHRLAGEGSP